MSFYTDPSFYAIVALLCVPAIVMGYKGIRPKAYGLFSSVIMLACLFCRDVAGALSFGVFLAVCVSTTYFTLWLFRNDKPHAVALYRVALAVALLPLICAKASSAFDANILGFIGISYLTFKNVQVLIEIRDGLIDEMSFSDFVYFMLFFPVFTSGPIMRSRDFVAQLSEPLERESYLRLLVDGAARFVRGVLYYFVLAMIMQWLQWFGPTLVEDGTFGGFALGQVIQAFCYGLYLFFNFAGYSLMAIGIGAAFGIKVPPNFNAPFLSLDIKDYWNRWHLTLSYWMRDFVFMRLSRMFMKHKTFRSRLTTACVSYIINMTLMGLWHGFTIDYLVYGLYQGLLLAGCDVFQKKTKFYKKYRNETWFKVCSWAVNMVAVFVGFALFSGQIPELVRGAL